MMARPPDQKHVAFAKAIAACVAVEAICYRTQVSVEEACKIIAKREKVSKQSIERKHRKIMRQAKDDPDLVQRLFAAVQMAATAGAGPMTTWCMKDGEMLKVGPAIRTTRKFDK